MERINEAAQSCPKCGGNATVLGGLGRVRWLSCPPCGINWHRETRSRYTPEAVSEKKTAQQCIERVVQGEDVSSVANSAITEIALKRKHGYS